MSTSTNEVLRDVWDGAALKPLVAQGQFFSDKHHLALSLSTDGIPLFKSSKLSLWPVYLIILNLPIKYIRTKSQNIVLCGVWAGPTKPLMNNLLDPILNSIEQLSTSGVSMVSPSGNNMTIRARLVMGIFDLPAKAAVLAAKQFNGKFGCSVCLHPGKRLNTNSRVYLPDAIYPNRTHLHVVRAAAEAIQTGTCIQGVYGESPLSGSIDLVNSIPIDYMHCVLEGVTKWILNAWFDSKHHSEPYYLGRCIKEIDHQLVKQHPPNEFSRPPRSIQKHLKFWKASELQYWLLFYSLPILLHHLPALYWYHYSLLVCAMHILLGDSISSNQIDAAEMMLKDFNNLMPELYGEGSCTHNCHLLSHLTKYVRLWGPLWTHSAFGYESKNGNIKYLIHGKNEVVHQLIFNIDTAYTLQYIRSNFLNECEPTLHCIDAFTNHSPRNSEQTCIGSHTYIIGKSKTVTPSAEQARCLDYEQPITYFLRLIKDGIIYYSKEYVKDKQRSLRDNTHCCYKDTAGRLRFGSIELFVHSPAPCGLIHELKPLSTTLIDMAGHPCRTSLLKYQEADLLNLYITHINLNTDSNELVSVPISRNLKKKL